MKYCVRCITADTRPHIRMDEAGVCNACVAFESRATIDWDRRREAFEQLAADTVRAGSLYDCVVPVSGGKDSTWQVVTCLESGLRPLAVTWRPPGRTELGQRNLDNLVHLGVDHIDYRIDPRVERDFTLRSYEQLGSTAVPMHMALFNIPLNLAVRYRIPLVVWGENSAFEYGGSEEEQAARRLDSAWLRSFGVTHGTTAHDWVSSDLSAKDLAPYFGPSDDELDAAGVDAVFLGYYLPWDPAKSLEVAKGHGFTTRAEGPRTGYYDFADLDDEFISVHHWLKWYKFGFTRLFDNLCLEIRHGRMTRDHAIEIVRTQGDQTPRSDIEALCDFLRIPTQRFYDIAERFRDNAIWSHQGGRWMIPDFLIPDWDW